MPLRIFGRNPLVILAAVQGVLAFLITIPALGITQEVAAGFMVVLSGLLAFWEAAAARPVVIPAITGAIRTVLVGVAGFGFVIPEATLAAGLAAGGLLLALLTQPNTTPVVDPHPDFKLAA